MANEKTSETPTMVRFGMAVADWCERWFPDALVFAILATKLSVYSTKS
ncbi:MAG: hypothetical protein ACLP5H_23025 [Desulfomonilaceae bacterium]